MMRGVMTRQRTVDRIEDTTIHQGHSAAHRVRQVLEPGRWREHDPFLMLAEDWFVPGTFGDHPHRGFETITLVLEGELEHRDNHGGHGRLGPGDVQWMTAGRGVVHSEEAASPVVHSLQLWVNLPKRLKMTEPRYQDLRGVEMPVREENGARLRVYSGDSGDARATTRTHIPILMVDLRVDPGASVAQALPNHFNAFVYVIAGSGHFGAEGRRAEAGQVVWFAPGADATPSEITVAADASLHAILWAGEPLREPVASRGPFVMNTMGEVMQAFVDFQEGRF